MACYLIHFERPYQHARHYVGFVDTDQRPLDQALPSRMSYHRRGRGSRLLRAVTGAGIAWEVVRVWPEGTRAHEKALKVRSGTRLCPLCNATYAANGKLEGSLVGTALSPFLQHLE